MIIRIKNLYCGYGKLPVLKDITLDVKQGEHLGIIGPNGSGKTTLIRAITRLVKPISGGIEIFGRDVRNTDLKEISKKVAVVGQVSKFIEDMNVMDYVLLGRLPHFRWLQIMESKKDIQICLHCLDITGTLRLKDRFMYELSSGERQLISIARALSQDPSIIILDEPTSHLDISHQVRILDTITNLIRQNGITAVTVMHDLNLASEYCDRLVLLDDGRIKKIGTPQEVLTYSLIEEVYKTVVIVKENPISHKPYVFVVPHVDKS